MSRRSRSSSVTDAFARVETERLVLRRPTADDLDDVERIHGDPAVWTHSPNRREGWDRAECEANLERWIDAWAADGVGFWAVEREGSVIGFGGLMWLRGRQGWPDFLNVYYRFEPGAWGNGYATEMVRAAIALARAHLPGAPLVVGTRPTNAEAARVAVRTGFERRPDLDRSGMHVYALDWR
jgi:[ribosomal protein S5]-alanine N-acetyltransferase